MARKSKAEKQKEAYVEKLVGRALVGNPISVMDIGKVFVKANELVTAGGDEQSIAASLLAFTQELAAKVA